LLHLIVSRSLRSLAN